MFTVPQKWIDENAKRFVEQSSLICIIQQKNGLTPYIPASRIVSLSADESGSMLSSKVTQQKITIEFDNRDGYFGSVDAMTTRLARNNFIDIRPSFGGTGISRWNGFIKEFAYNTKKMTVSVEVVPVLAFMGIKYQHSLIPQTISETLSNIEEQATESDIIPELIDPIVPNKKVYIDYSEIENDDAMFQFDTNVTMADVLQSIANATRCVIISYGASIKFIRAVDETANDYTITRFIQYDKPETIYNDSIKQLKYSYYDGAVSVTDSSVETGSVAEMNNKAFLEQYSADGYADETAEWALEKLVNGRVTYTGTFRVDPRVELFDIIKIQRENRTVLACIIELKCDYNGGWKGTYKAVHVGEGALITDIYSLEGFAINDLEIYTLTELEDGQVYEHDLQWTQYADLGIQDHKTDSLDWDVITDNFNKIDTEIWKLGL